MADESANQTLNVDEAASFLGISKTTLYRLIAEEAIRGSKVGKRWRFRTEDLVAYRRWGPSAQVTAPASIVRPEIEFLDGLIEAAGGDVGDEYLARTGLDSENHDAGWDLAWRIMRLAILRSAASIHLEPCRGEGRGAVLRFRLRADGVLQTIRILPPETRELLIARFKVLADMVATDRRRPQDGLIPVRHENREYTVHANSIPSVYGESFVMRITPPASVPLLAEIPFQPDERVFLERLMRPGSGLVLAVGPTGSGKTTLLYSLLRELVSDERKVMAVADPVHYDVPGIVQVRGDGVNERGGLAFARAVENFESQDADVIGCQEIESEEVARVCARAAITGHLVLATMHAEDAPEALKRLKDFGVASYSLRSTLRGIAAQRLVGKICEHCRAAVAPDERDSACRSLVERASEEGWSVAPDAVLFDAPGCEKCHGRGFTGRRPILETLAVGDRLGDALAGGASAAELRRLAIEGGMRSFVASGMRLVEQGVLSLREVVRLADM